MKNKILSLTWVCITIWLIAYVNANSDSLRALIQWYIGDNHSYVTQTITILDDTFLINLWDDDSLIGDFFLWGYYDSAYWAFSFDKHQNGVSITNILHSCVGDTSTHSGYKLQWNSLNDNFGAVNFSQAYVCVPQDNDSWLQAYIWWRVYSELLWYQNFSKVFFDPYVGQNAVAFADGRYVRIDGVTSSQNYREIDNEFANDVRVIWDVTKSSLRWEILQNVYGVVRNAPINNQNLSLSAQLLSGNVWASNSGWKVLQNGTVLYYGGLDGEIVTINSNWTVDTNIEWKKTLVVEGGNIYIRWNIRNTDNDTAMLWLIAISKENDAWETVGGNIYIHPSVTDIHANIYADRSVISYDNIHWEWFIPTNNLRNQLYVYGSIFSENTIGWASDINALVCPFYIKDVCSETVAKKYDFNYLRTYILVSQVISWQITSIMEPSNGGAESYMWDNSNSNSDVQKRRYPFIIEYNPEIQNSPPPFF